MIIVILGIGNAPKNLQLRTRGVKLGQDFIGSSPGQHSEALGFGAFGALAGSQTWSRYEER